MTGKTSSTHRDRQAEGELVALALRGVKGNDEDARQDAALALFLKQRRGEAIDHPFRLANVIAKRRRIDSVRKSARNVLFAEITTQASGGAGDGDTLEQRKRRVRALAQAKSLQERWDPRWRYAVHSMLSRCADCEGEGVRRRAPLAKWTRVPVTNAAWARTHFPIGADIDTVVFPPRCSTCEGGGDAPAETNVDSHTRKRARKTAKAKLAAVKKRVAATGQLDGDFVSAHFAASAERAEGLRRKLVMTLCTRSIGETTSPTARDLGLAALIVGDWPIPETTAGVPCDDWRRMTDGQIIEAMTRAMRSAHRLARGLVEPLSARAPAARRAASRRIPTHR